MEVLLVDGPAAGMKVLIDDGASHILIMGPVYRPYLKGDSSGVFRYEIRDFILDDPRYKVGRYKVGVHGELPDIEATCDAIVKSGVLPCKGH